MSSKRSMAGIRVSGLEKTFDRERVLNGVDLSVEPGEFCILVGPSGSGKSTVLKAIAGLVEPDGGQIQIGGRDVADVPVNQRNLGFVFQEFEETLFPHMTVAENVAFGLEQAPENYSSSEIESRVNDMLELLAIDETREDTPDELSGGQQQRVELARQLVRDCDVMLLDDPLADLDYKLQKRMELELRRLHAESGGTYLYVTHNQEQALTLADTLVVVNEGRVEQAGTPTEVYERPANAYVGRFIGDSTLFKARFVNANGDAVTAETPVGTLDAKAAHDGIETGTEGVVLVRPEDVALGTDADDCVNRFVGRPQDRIYTGEQTEFLVTIDSEDGEQTVQSRYPGNVSIEEVTLSDGDTDTVSVGWDASEAAAFTRLSAGGETTVDDLWRL